MSPIGSFTLVASLTMTPWSPPAARRRGRALGSRCDTAGTVGTRLAPARTGGSACTRARGTSPAAPACSSTPSSPSPRPSTSFLATLARGSGRRRRHRDPLEGEPERDQQRPSLVVVPRARHDRDVHAPDLQHLVVVDLREDQLLGQTQRVVAVAVEGARVQPTEVPDPGDRDGDEPIDELPHPVAPKGDLGADRLPPTQLEPDRKSTRRNSSHLGISYAVFCWKK